MKRSHLLLIFCLSLPLTACKPEAGNQGKGCPPKAVDSSDPASAQAKLSRNDVRDQWDSKTLGKARNAAGTSSPSYGSSNLEAMRHRASKIFDNTGDRSGLSSPSGVYAGNSGMYPPREKLPMQRSRKIRVSGDAPPSPDLRGARSVTISHPALGERLTLAYKSASGRINAAAMRQANRLFRDRRNGKSSVVPPELLDVLAKIQNRFHGKTIQIVSGYRSPETNAALRRKSSGVAKRSMHMTGKAVDIRIPGVSPREIGAYARSLKAGGVGTYGSFVHVDTGRVRTW